MKRIRSTDNFGSQGCLGKDDIESQAGSPRISQGRERDFGLGFGSKIQFLRERERVTSCTYYHWKEFLSGGNIDFYLQRGRGMKRGDLSVTYMLQPKATNQPNTSAPHMCTRYSRTEMICFNPFRYDKMCAIIKRLSL